MMFNIAVTENLTKVIQVEADDLYTAIKEAGRIYNKEKLTPSIDDFGGFPSFRFISSEIV